MGGLDWAVVGGYFLVMIWIGVWSKRRISNARDFYVADGKIPWWLTGMLTGTSDSASAFATAAPVSRSCSPPVSRVARLPTSSSRARGPERLALPSEPHSN